MLQDFGKPITRITSVRQIISRAMRQPDDLVIMLDYIESKGVESQRVVSPIRFLARDRFLALGLCREEPRQFYLDRCRNVRLVQASDVLMPMPLVEVVACS